jgi:hypothetical protein
MVRTQDTKASRSIARKQPTYTITRRDRHWEVRDPVGELVCLTVYKRGAQEVVRRISLVDARGRDR